MGPLSNRFDIPAPRHCGREKCIAFKSALVLLFDQYPELEELPEGHGKTAAYWRERALINIDTLDLTGEMVRTGTYQACDTGVPNDLILAVYAQLFL